MIGHDGACGERVDVAEDEVPHVLDPLAADVAPEQSLGGHVSAEAPVIPKPGEHVVHHAPRARNALEAEVPVFVAVGSSQVSPPSPGSPGPRIGHTDFVVRNPSSARQSGSRLFPNAGIRWQRSIQSRRVANADDPSRQTLQPVASWSRMLAWLSMSILASMRVAPDSRR